MSALIFHILAITLLLVTPALGYDLLIVQSGRQSGYEEALKGVRSVCKVSSRVVVLDDYAAVDLPQIVREDQPAVILAVGDPALAAARKVKRVPVVSLLALGTVSQKMPVNITGVDMLVPPERYLALFNAFQLKRVGIIYSSTRSGAYLKKARDAAERLGIELVLREVQNPRQTSKMLDALPESVDAVWMLADTTAVTRENIEAYFIYCQKHAIPLISFAGVYLGKGAAAVLEVDHADMGKQAGEIANSLLRGATPDTVPVAAPRQVHIKTNPVVARQLGLDIQRAEKLSKPRQE